MQNALLTKFIQKNKRTDIPTFRPGDTIRVHVKIKEGDKERVQLFEGDLIARHNTGLGETITVRKVSFGQGVERIFPLHAKVIDHIDVVRTGQRAAGQAVLPARTEGQGRPSERARIVDAVPHATRVARVANSVVKPRWSESCARAAFTLSRVSTKSAAGRCSARWWPPP